MPDQTDLIQSATDFLDKVRINSEVRIMFRKKDNSQRVMKCTLDFDKIPNRDKPKSVNLSKILKMLNDKGILHVYDLDKGAWRSVNFKTVVWLETKEAKYFIKK